MKNREDFWGALIIILGVVTVFLLAIALHLISAEGAQVTNLGPLAGKRAGDDALIEDVIDMGESLQEGINEVDGTQIKDETITDDDISSADTGRLSLNKLGDGSGSYSSLNYMLSGFIYGLNCVASNPASNDYWYVTSGSVGITTGTETRICYNPNNLTAASLAGMVTTEASGTYDGYVVDDGDGSFSMTAKANPSTASDGQRKVCEILLNSSKKILSIANTVDIYHTSDEVTENYPTATRMISYDGSATVVQSQEIVTGWDYIVVPDGGAYYGETTVSLASAGLNEITIPPVITYIGFNSQTESDGITEWTSFTDATVGDRPHEYKTIMSVYAPSQTMGSAFKVWVARSNNYCNAPAENCDWDNYLPAGTYGFSYMVTGK